MGRVNRGPIPSDLGWLVDELDGIRGALRTLQAPDGQQLGQTIARLNAAVAELEEQQVELAAQQATLTTLVNNIDQTLADFIANDVQAIVAAEVQAALNARLAGNVSIGGGLTVAGTVVLPGARGTNVGGTTPNRVAAWIAGDGTLGYT